MFIMKQSMKDIPRHSHQRRRLMILLEKIKNNLSMVKEKLYRSVNGEYLYLFNWTCGGFNDVWAKSKREAYAKVMRERKEHEKQYPTHSKLRPDYKSMRKCTYSQYQEQNRMGWMMSM